jgi:hypothetical protein
VDVEGAHFSFPAPRPASALRHQIVCEPLPGMENVARRACGNDFRLFPLETLRRAERK